MEATINKQLPREVFTTNWARLKQERQPVFDHCREINQSFMPRTGRFFEEQPNARAGRRNLGIYDNTATRAAQTTAASILTTASSEAKPWFRLSTGDTNLDKLWEVRVYLDDVTRQILDTFSQSNVYQVLHQMYLELVLYGTACAILTEDDEDLIRLIPLTFGEYCLITDAAGRVVGLYREVQMTCEQLVTKFGKDRVSPGVLKEMESNQLTNWHKVLHVIEPRDRYDPSSESPLDRKWRSVYLELDCGDNKEYQGLLKESGYDRFPVIAPRWDVQGHDVYGTSPAMTCLGDVQSLQQAQFRLHQAIDYKTKPPVQLPPAMRGAEVDMSPGGRNYIGGTQPAKNLFDVNLEIDAMRELIIDIRERILSAMLVDVFLSLLSASDTTQRTAEEIRERRDEKFQLLGPVTNRLGSEQHAPLVVFTFYELMKANKLPPMPAILSERTLRVEFISVLAQAQKAIATVGVDRMMANVMAIGQTQPKIWNKIDLYYWADFYSERYAIDPKLIRPTKDAVAAEEAQNLAMAAKEQALHAEQMSKTFKNVADARAQEPITGPEANELFSGAAPAA